MKFCKYCGAQLESDSQFCPNCGRKVNNQPSPKLKSHSMTKQRKLLTLDLFINAQSAVKLVVKIPTGP